MRDYHYFPHKPTEEHSIVSVVAHEAAYQKWLNFLKAI